MHYFFAVALTVAALEGHWIAARYADALASTRSPSRAEKIEAPVAVTIKGNRAEVTDFHEGSWRIIKSVEERAIVVSPLEAPDGKPTRRPLTITRDGHGAVIAIHAALWPET
jgi:type II secretory pathway component PulL